MHSSQRVISIVTGFATVLALIVVVLGAYTRLTDSGLGCPDWPGCYGHVMVPSTQVQIQQATHAFPTAPFYGAHAWP